MKPIVNVQETIGKTVGRRQPPSDPLNAPGDTIANARAWQRAFPFRFPKGVYRFKSYEEADAWMLKMMIRPAKD